MGSGKLPLDTVMVFLFCAQASNGALIVLGIADCIFMALQNEETLLRIVCGVLLRILHLILEALLLPFAPLTSL